MSVETRRLKFDLAFEAFWVGFWDSMDLTRLDWVDSHWGTSRAVDLRVFVPKCSALPWGGTGSGFFFGVCLPC
jgi:hypothetical protein